MPQPEGARRRRARLGRREEAESPAAEGGARGRGIWSGSISFGLVTVPIELYSAHRGGAVPQRMLAPDGVPLARQYVCSEEGVPLEDDEIVRGYEVAPGEFVIVGDDELEALAPRRSRDIELDRFVDRDAIDPGYLERAYFLVPGGSQTKAYRLLAETMERTRRAAIASFVMRDKAYAVAIFADRGVLRAGLLRFGDELRSPETLGLPDPGRVDAARVKKMQKAIEALAADEVDESELRDDADERLLALAREKRERGEDVVEAPAAPGAPEEEEEEGGKVVDLVALLKQRLRASGAGGAGARRAAEKPAAAARRAGQRERKPAKKAAGRAGPSTKSTGRARRGGSSSRAR